MGESNARLQGGMARYRSTGEVVGAAVRMLRAVGERVDDPDELDAFARLADELRQAERVAVAGLRAAGFTDGRIAAGFAVSRQAVQRRFPR